MKFLQNLRKAANSLEIRHRISSISATGRCFYNQFRSQSSNPSSFGIAFDIDGVILRGEIPIGGSPQALKRLYDDSGTLRIPYVFLTNGGGVPESSRAAELSKLLKVHISPVQVPLVVVPLVLTKSWRSTVPGYTGTFTFQAASEKRFENELIIAVGKGEPALVMSEYGFKKVLALDEYASYFEHIDPLGKFKNWKQQVAGCDKSSSGEMGRVNDPCSQKVQAVFVVSDSVDWSRDIQVLCDILSTGGLPGRNVSTQPPLFFANDDLSYQDIYPNVLEYTSYGKPNPSVFRNAEKVLMQVVHSTSIINPRIDGRLHPFRTLYMIGDNPSVDIKGAQQAGQPWFSILTRSGVFKGKENQPLHPADLVVDTVDQAVDYILRKEAF
ncbi:hypothetical protein OROGR_019810 [Orobanche gracilis]